MRTFLKSLAVALLVVASSAVWAQTDEVVTEEPTTDETTAVCVPVGGAYRGAMGQARGAGSEFRTAFRATLSEEQLAILENRELTRDEKRTMLQESMTEEQREMFDAHQQLMQEQRQGMANAYGKGNARQGARQGAQQNAQRGMRHGRGGN